MARARSDGVEAAKLHGWGAPVAGDEFNGPTLNENERDGWTVYVGPGSGGVGHRVRSAITQADGVLSIRGDARGNTGGMYFHHVQRFGGWEVRMRMPVSAPHYHVVALLWPAGRFEWPQGGEVDYVEVGDPTRQELEGYLHYGVRNSQLYTGIRRIDLTQWHNFAVRWTTTSITYYVDGQPWWTTSQRSALPPDVMAPTLQLDATTLTGLGPGEMHVDWLRIYA